MIVFQDISSRELRQKLNKLHKEMDFVSMVDVKEVIRELENKVYKNSKDCAITNKF